MARKSQYRRPPTREVRGILLLDKPLGLSSNQALQKVRSLYNATKAGHTGALDPLATGLLPICLGEATKIAGLLLSESKAYRARVQLGAETDTDDAEGQIVRRRAVPALDRDVVAAVLPQFTGRILQVPPRYSALKRDGEPLYLRARRGETFDVPAREVDVIRIDLLELGPDWLEVEVECGSGTYIRSLARDIGDALECGGHIASLRRLWVDPFRSPVMVTLDQLTELAGDGASALDALLMPIQSGLPDWRQVVLDESQVRCLRHGQRPQVNTAAGPVLAMSADGEAIGLTEVLGDGSMAARRLFQPLQGGSGST
ncbi:tRNA pseudouridine(55) synthase TruB [Xanthomonadaceae bacterium JHOS43]|nr:tRNA pseudouridine(55) synthase TruB [Xanthomonadaceae bacterium JHOS43]